MGRKFVRISLGGVRDEAEIRGHRRTYIGALPGRIIQAHPQRRARNNPVFMLDEIDKLGMDFRGDPASALLEVLDPEQNSRFLDHYLDVPFDLSKVMFITTANMLDPIPPALRDRMEVIELAGLHRGREARDRAARYLIPQAARARTASADEQIELRRRRRSTRSSASYTREAGVRNLEREIGRVCRKVARRDRRGRHASRVDRRRRRRSHELLGPAQLLLARSPSAPTSRASPTGLAWTPIGGEILFIEATRHARQEGG